jgi:hypothetical protein
MREGGQALVDVATRSGLLEVTLEDLLHLVGGGGQSVDLGEAKVRPPVQAGSRFGKDLVAEGPTDPVGSIGERGTFTVWRRPMRGAQPSIHD